MECFVNSLVTLVVCVLKVTWDWPTWNAKLTTIDEAKTGVDLTIKQDKKLF
jgi:hypothetical protein